jgi:hypothetical protein
MKGPHRVASRKIKILYNVYKPGNEMKGVGEGGGGGGGEQRRRQERKEEKKGKGKTHMTQVMIKDTIL